MPFSWTVIGIYWLQHHFTVKLIARSDHLTNVYNLLLLMTVALLPWSTSIFGSALADDRDVGIAALIYIDSLGLPAVAWNLFFRHLRRSCLLNPLLEPAYVRRLSRFYVVGLLAYLRTPPSPAYCEG